MPRPISPVLEGFAHKEVTYARGQPQYQPLPALRSPKGLVLSRWKLTEAEREAIKAGVDIFLSIQTLNDSLQPIMMEVGVCDRDFEAMACAVGLTEEDKA